MKLQGKWAASVADVSAGEMLYLPAGWFHEVTSVGGPEAGGHLALNYWMHPPDNLHASPSDSPYVHLLWPALWQKRVKHMPAYVAAGDAKDEPITPECRLCKDSVGKSGKHRKNTKAGGRPTAPWPAGVSKSQPNKSHALGSAGPEASNKNVNKEHISGFGDVDSWFGAQSGCHQSLAVQEDMLSMVLSSSMSHAPSSKNTKKKRKRRGNSHAE